MDKNLYFIIILVIGLVISYLVGAFFDSGEFAIAFAICFYSSLFVSNTKYKSKN